MAALQKRSVLVLGGSRGIGAAIVRRFAADGASVVFSYAGSPDAAAQLAAETGSVAIQTDSRPGCGDKTGAGQRAAGCSGG